MQAHAEPSPPRPARVIFHVDMDAFYASIEQRDRPELRGKPVIVGSLPSQRGVVCAASYEARKFGVRSAMPSATAGRLCPRGLFVRPRMDHYRQESRKVMRILADTQALLEPVSIDEAYLELTQSLLPTSARPEADPDALLNRALPQGRWIKARIFEELGLTASIGIAANKFLAKLGSDFKKPDGLTLIPENGKVEFLRPLPVRAIHGIGQVTEQALKSAGIETIAHLQDYPGDLRALVGAFAARLRLFALGEDDRPLDLSDEVKSISSEETFDRDTDDRPLLRACLRQQAAEIAERLRTRRLAAHTVQIKLRYSDFTTLTRQVSFEEAITDARDIYRLSCWLLARDRLVCRPLRLLGVGVSGLRELTCRQMVFPLFK